MTEEELLDSIETGAVSQLVTECTPTRLSGFIEGHNAAFWPDSPLDSMLVSPRLPNDLQSKSLGSHLSTRVLIELLRADEPLQAYATLQRTLARPRRRVAESQPTPFVRILELGPDAERVIPLALDHAALWLGNGFDALQVAVWLERYSRGLRDRGGKAQVAVGFTEWLTRRFSYSSDSWCWARLLWVVAGESQSSLVTILLDEWDAFRNGALPERHSLGELLAAGVAVRLVE